MTWYNTEAGTRAVDVNACIVSNPEAAPQDVVFVFSLMLHGWRPQPEYRWSLLQEKRRMVSFKSQLVRFESPSGCPPLPQVGCCSGWMDCLF